MHVDFELVLPDTEILLKQKGLDKQGRVQKVIDTQFIRLMRKKMPQREGILKASVYRAEPGLIVVDTPYAHYMNEGILYVDAKTGSAWGRRGYAKVPTGKPLNYVVGGSHFVERTIVQNGREIAEIAQKEIR